MIRPGKATGMVFGILFASLMHTKCFSQPSPSLEKVYDAFNEYNLISSEKILTDLHSLYPDSTEITVLLSMNYHLAGYDSLQQVFAKKAMSQYRFAENRSVKNLVYGAYAIANRQWQQAIHHIDASIPEISAPAILTFARSMLVSEAGMPSTNFKFTDSVLSVEPKLKSIPLMQWLEAQMNFSRGQIQPAEKLANDLLDDKKPFLSLLAHRLLGEINEQKEAYAQALSHFKKGLELSEKIKFSRGITTIAQKYARVCFSLHYEGRPGIIQEGLEYLKQAAQLAKQMKNNADLAEILLVKATLDRESTIGAAVNEQVHDLQTLHTLAIQNNYAQHLAAAKSGLGYVYIALGREPDSAWLFKQDASAYFQSRNIRRWSMGTNLSWFWRQKGRLDMAEQYALSAMQLAKESNRQHAITEATFHLGETWLAMGRLEKVRDLYDESYALVKGKQIRDEAVFLAYLARLEWVEGKKKEAIIHAREAAEQLSKFELFYEIFARASLAGMLCKNGNYAAVFTQHEYLKKYTNRFIPYESVVRLKLYNIQALAKTGKQQEAVTLLRLLKEELRKKNLTQLLLELEFAEADILGSSTNRTGKSFREMADRLGYKYLSGHSLN